MCFGDAGRPSGDSEGYTAAWFMHTDGIRELLHRAEAISKKPMINQVSNACNTLLELSYTQTTSHAFEQMGLTDASTK